MDKSKKTKSALISLIVPVYNVEEYLPRCMESIFAQTYRELEIILINDGSTDKSGEICESYSQIDSRVKIIHQDNTGISGARNAGLDIMQGEWFGFVDADDYIDPKMYEKLLNMAVEHKQQVASSGYVVHDLNKENLYIVHPELFPVISVYKFLEYQAYGKDIAPVFAMLFHRSLIEDGNKERLDTRFYRGADNIFRLRVLHKAEALAYLPEPLYHYCKREESITTSGVTSKSMTRFDSHKQLITELKEISLKLTRLEQNRYTDYAVRWLWKTYKNEGESVRFRQELRRLAKEHAVPYLFSLDVTLKKKAEFFAIMFFPGLTYYIWAKSKKKAQG
jgi:glycosyltransferase involved in cell wall biosynthesis